MCIYYSFGDVPAGFIFDYETYPDLRTKEENYPGCAHRYVRICEGCPEARKRGSRCPQPEHQILWEVEVGYCLKCAAREPTEMERTMIRRWREREERQGEPGPSGL